MFSCDVNRFYAPITNLSFLAFLVFSVLEFVYKYFPQLLKSTIEVPLKGQAKKHILDFMGTILYPGPTFFMTSRHPYYSATTRTSFQTNAMLVDAGAHLHRCRQ